MTRTLTVEPPEAQNQIANKIKDPSKSVFTITKSINNEEPSNHVTQTITTTKQINEGPQFKLTNANSNSGGILPLYANQDATSQKSVTSIKINPNNSIIKETIRMPNENTKVMSLSSQGPFLANKSIVSQPVVQMNATT